MTSESAVIPYKLIKIQGKDDIFAIVDADDYNHVKKFKWFLIHGEERRSMYAMAAFSIPSESDYGEQEKIRLSMHRMILGTKLSSEEFEIDHINHNGLDNRKSNLRICKKIQNIHNSRKPRRGNNTYKGVSIGKNRYVAYCTTNGVRKHLGSFKNELDAVIAYNNHVLQIRGDFAWINDIQDKAQFDYITEQQLGQERVEKGLPPV